MSKYSKEFVEFVLKLWVDPFVKLAEIREQTGLTSGKLARMARDRSWPFRSEIREKTEQDVVQLIKLGKHTYTEMEIILGTTEHEIKKIEQKHRIKKVSLGKGGKPKNPIIVKHKVIKEIIPKVEIKPLIRLIDRNMETQCATIVGEPRNQMACGRPIFKGSYCRECVTRHFVPSRFQCM